MASGIERVVAQAVITFSRALGSTEFNNDLARLKRHADELNAQSVGLDFRLLRWDVYELSWIVRRMTRPVIVGHRRVPVTYIRVFEDQHVSIGLFVLRKDAKIPFHDHPGMYGLLKVIYGKVKIQRLTTASKDHGGLNVGCSFDAVKLPSAAVGVADGSCMLYPDEGNIHQVTTVDGPAAFLDVLGPPYDADDGTRRCSYFEKTKHSGGIRLTKVQEPNNYRSDLARYTGPRFSVNVDGKK